MLGLVYTVVSRAVWCSVVVAPARTGCVHKLEG